MSCQAQQNDKSMKQVPVPYKEVIIFGIVVAGNGICAIERSV
jgi:hypothetical protein